MSKQKQDAQILELKEEKEEAQSEKNPLNNRFVQKTLVLARDIKAKKSYQKTRKASIDILPSPLSINTKKEKNLENLEERLRTGRGYHRVADYFGLPLPAGFSPYIAEHADEILPLYLHPFPTLRIGAPLKFEELRAQKNIQREENGAMQASRIGIYILSMIHLHHKHGSQEASNLTSEDIVLIQIAALFNNAAQQSPGSNKWLSESGEMCHDYFIKHGIDEERARIFSNALRQKDTLGPKTIAHKLIHDAVLIDRLCQGKNVELKDTNFYQDIACKDQQALRDLESLALKIREAIASQNDLKEGACITLDGAPIRNGEAIPATFDPEKKKKYEHAQNCFREAMLNMKGFLPLYESHMVEERKEEHPVQRSSSLAEEMMVELEEKDENQQPSPVISERESQLISMFLHIYLHHTMPRKVANAIFSSAILSSKVPALRDPEEQKRWGEPTITSHTPAFGGINDNVFFGLCLSMSHFSIPKFTEGEDIVTVFIDVEELLRSNPYAPLLKFWISGHFFHYQAVIDRSLEEGEDALIDGTKFSWRHLKNILGKTEFSQEMFYEDPDGTIRYQRINLGDEINAGENFREVLALRFIEHLRLLRKDNRLRQEILQNPDNKVALSKAMDNLLRVDFCEGKLPSGLSLNQPGVTLIYSKTLAEDEKSALQKKFPHIKFLSYEEIAQEMATAAKTGDIEALKLMFKKNYPLDGHCYRITRQPTPLIAAIRAGKSEVVEWLIQNGASQKCFEGGLFGAAIYTAASMTNYEKIELLEASYNNPEMLQLLHDNKFNSKNIIFEGILFTAADRFNGGPIARFLLDNFRNRYRFDLNLKNKEGLTPLHLAVLSGNLEFIKTLDEFGADLNALDNSGNNLLHYAAYHNRPEIVSYLADRGFDINATNKEDVTPLQLGIKYCTLETVKELEASGADLNVVDEAGNTLLHDAAYYNRPEIVTYFLSRGLDINAKSNAPYHNTVIDYAANNEGNLNIIILLREAGAIADYRTLKIAVAAGAVDIIKYLIEECKIDPNHKTDPSPLICYAITHKKLNSLATLHKAGAELVISDKRNLSFLRDAVERGNIEIVKYLLNEGRLDLHANKNANNYKGKPTPLELAKNS
ncbi:MAG: hypothetical protein K0R25_1101 [Rickettsiaceae bacterium]|jgi:ankyrin repeat protein|nr:hypothetical protein [Rickettsiaceae bacterium]